MSAQTAADLRAAADVLEQEGWTQYEYANDDGCLCASGALLFVASEGKFRRPSQMSDLSYRMVQETYRRWDDAKWLASETVAGGSLVQFNDTPGRTATEVIAALRAAADKADQS